MISSFDELLVRAALDHTRRADEAWELLRVDLDVDQLGPAQQRLLPTLHRNLVARHVQDVDLERLKGVYRRTWSENQLLCQQASEALDALRQNGVPTMLLKGAGLVSLGVHSFGARPMRDIDILVPTAQANRALDALAREGWGPKRDPHINSFDHAQTLARCGGREVDLHWHIAHALQLPGAHAGSDDDFWQRAVAVTFGGATTTTLSPTDHLMHAIVHGMQFHETALVWVLDAAALIDTGLIDWELLVAEAGCRHVVLPVRSALGWLHDHDIRSIPTAVLAQLADAPVSKRDVRNDRLRNQPPPSGLSDIRLGLWRWAAANTHNSVPRAIVTLPEFLRRYWHLDREWQVPARAARYAMARIRRDLGGRPRERGPGQPR